MSRMKTRNKVAAPTKRRMVGLLMFNRKNIDMSILAISKKIILIMGFLIMTPSCAEDVIVQGMSNDEFLQNFSLLVFGEEGDKKINKWNSKDEVQVAIVGDHREFSYPRVAQIVKLVKQKTGLNITMLRDNGEASMILNITYTPVYDMLVPLKNVLSEIVEKGLIDIKKFERIGGEHLYQVISNTATSEIMLYFYIGKPPKKKSEKASAIVTSIQQAFLHGLGFTELNYTGTKLSVMSKLFKGHEVDIDVDKLAFTEFDNAALNLLYQSDLKPGMTKKQALPIIRKWVDSH